MISKLILRKFPEISIITWQRNALTNIHRHIYPCKMTVLSGTIQHVTYESGLPKTQVMSAGDNVLIHRHQAHQVLAIEKSKTLHVYSDDIGRDEPMWLLQSMLYLNLSTLEESTSLKKFKV